MTLEDRKGNHGAVVLLLLTVVQCLISVVLHGLPFHQSKSSKGRHCWKNLQEFCTTLARHEVPLIDDFPVYQHYRRHPPPSQCEQVKAHIQELISSGIIQLSCRPYTSLLVIVRKKGGSTRLCVDCSLLKFPTSLNRFDPFPCCRLPVVLPVAHF